MKGFPLARAMRAVRALKPGEEWSVVLFDRQAVVGTTDGKHSLRAVVSRRFTKEGMYTLELQEYSGLGWTYYGLDRADAVEDFHLDIEDVPIILAYYVNLAERDRRSWERENGLDDFADRAEDAATRHAALLASWPALNDGTGAAHIARFEDTIGRRASTFEAMNVLSHVGRVTHDHEDLARILGGELAWLPDCDDNGILGGGYETFPADVPNRAALVAAYEEELRTCRNADGPNGGAA